MSEQRPPAHPPIATASKPAPDEPWAELRRFTAARIALPRSGASLATAPLLEFRLAHARARDAVHAPFDTAQLCAALATVSTGNPSGASSAHSCAVSNGACTASRARAWASRNSSSGAVASEAPLRGNAIRAAVKRRRSAHGSSGALSREAGAIGG